ncbi:LRR receptor-like serine/threonine-protein kinase ERL1 [Rosa chinensis]|uniref:LRR receptor-like serine/threonine-protein kinase ERL1 n=1 Tax=Rosa chinensis TaxID=74649 RepID=UPI001AD8E36B|nr:LRR receptor-like serine/threonine-protein kinase ERL1 [Rosa chinensis]
MTLCLFANCRDLQGNKLTDQIPDEIGNCASLMYLDLDDNYLSGDIPFSVSKLKKLKVLDGVSESQFNQVLNVELDQIIELLTKSFQAGGSSTMGQSPISFMFLYLCIKIGCDFAKF